jgi:hypothetical protein
VLPSFLWMPDGDAAVSPADLEALRKSMERAEQNKADLRTELAGVYDYGRRVEIRKSLRELDEYVGTIRKQLERGGFGHG